MKLPIIISEHGDIHVFRSLEDACSYLEPIDVKNDEYVAFDANGFSLTLGFVKKQHIYFGFLKINTLAVTILDDKHENKAKDLATLLINFLNTVGIKNVEGNISLPDLIFAVENYLNTTYSK